MFIITFLAALSSSIPDHVSVSLMVCLTGLEILILADMATTGLQQCYNKVTAQLQQGYTRLHQGYIRVTAGLHQGYNRVTARLQLGYCRETAGKPQGRLGRLD